MKQMRVIGIVALVLAVLVAIAAGASIMMRAGTGPFAAQVSQAHEAQEALASAQANVKAAESAIKRAQSAESAVDAAKQALEAAEEAVQALAAQAAGPVATVGGVAVGGAGASDAETALDAQGLSAKLRTVASWQGQAAQSLDQMDKAMPGAWGAYQSAHASLGEAREGINRAQAAADDAAQLLERVTMVPAVEAVTALQEATEKAQKAVNETRQTLTDLRKQIGQASAAEAADNVVSEDAAMQPATLAEAQAVLEAQRAWLSQLSGQAIDLQAMGQVVRSAAEMAQAGAVYGQPETFVLWMEGAWILLLFTAVLLAAVGAICLFFGEGFLRSWKRNPVFSTMIALVIMLVLQTYSMRFTYSTLGEWFRAWGDNAFNVLRANTSVGIIALGMTLVIITGGIDLAVGSTLAGVGTVLMVLIDPSARGLLQGLGITGVLAFALGILGGCLTGVIIGGLIGLGVTKGRVPPFIITLGVMNIVRSLAQYFTKSYTPKVPAEFTAIANTVIFGQRLLPIVYWLVLAVILHVVMTRTAFGRYVYAVGSNERTTRLSGISVDKVKIKVYTLMGLLVSIAAVTQVSRLGGMDVASSGNGYELDAIAAVVVGGASMSGGRGTIVGTVLGVLIIGVMNNLLILLGVDSFLTNAFKGAIVIAAVLLQRKEKTA